MPRIDVAQPVVGDVQEHELLARLEARQAADLVVAQQRELDAVRPPRAAGVRVRVRRPDAGHEGHVSEAVPLQVEVRAPAEA